MIKKYPDRQGFETSTIRLRTRYQAEVTTGGQTWRVKLFNSGTVIGIQIKQKDLTKTFMLISSLKNPFDLHVLYKTYITALRVNLAEAQLGTVQKTVIELRQGVCDSVRDSVTNVIRPGRL